MKYEAIVSSDCVSAKATDALSFAARHWLLRYLWRQPVTYCTFCFVCVGAADFGWVVRRLRAGCARAQRMRSLAGMQPMNWPRCIIWLCMGLRGAHAGGAGNLFIQMPPNLKLAVDEEVAVQKARHDALERNRLYNLARHTPHWRSTPVPATPCHWQQHCTMRLGLLSPSNHARVARGGCHESWRRG
jgi:hypothetical protein